MKEMRYVQECFMKKVGEEDWETVTTRFPDHTTYNALKSFKGIKDLEKKPPESFLRFCVRAVNISEGKVASTGDDHVVTCHGSTITIVKYSNSQTSLLELKEALVRQEGANLVIIDLLNFEISSEEMDMLTRVIKDVNMRTLISSYQLVLIVDVKSMHNYNQDGALWRFAHLKSGGRKVIGLLYFMYMEARNPNLVTDLFTCDDLSSLVAEMLSSSSASVLMTDQATGVKAVKALEKKREIVFVTKCETADVLHQF
ncbi:uncharacterized protein [Ptychodera flava]